MIDLRNLGLSECICRYFRLDFHDLLFKSGQSNNEQQPQMDNGDQFSIAYRSSGGESIVPIENSENGGSRPASSTTLDFFI